MLMKEYEKLTFAEKLSLLLRDPEIPDRIEEIIKDGLNNLYNGLSWKFQYEIESSPQYIDVLIRGSKEPKLAEEEGKEEEKEEESEPEPTWPEFF